MKGATVFWALQRRWDTGGDFAYTWDAENRLIGFEPLAPIEGSKKLEFKYDFMGRRVEKKVFDWDETAGWDTPPSLWRRFVYYNWLPLLELNVEEDGGSETVTVLRKYTWGLDLAGQSGPGNSIDEAGGIGGLLATYDTAGTPETSDDASYYYLYDANGNVVQVLDASDGTVAAKYDYDAYGNRIDTPDPSEYDQPFRFSTKYWDDETGLGYWGYRYYSSRLGRWLSRDPLGEFSDYALLRYAANCPPNAIDSVGLCTPPTPACIAKHIKAGNYDFAEYLLDQYLQRKPFHDFVHSMAGAVEFTDSLIEAFDFEVGFWKDIREERECCLCDKLHKLKKTGREYLIGITAKAKFNVDWKYSTQKQGPCPKEGKYFELELGAKIEAKGGAVSGGAEVKGGLRIGSDGKVTRFGVASGEVGVGLTASVAISGESDKSATEVLVEVEKGLGGSFDIGRVRNYKVTLEDTGRPCPEESN